MNLKNLSGKRAGSFIEGYNEHVIYVCNDGPRPRKHRRGTLLHAGAEHARRTILRHQIEFSRLPNLALATVSDIPAILKQESNNDAWFTTEAKKGF